jgi:hypothetical protein
MGVCGVRARGRIGIKTINYISYVSSHTKKRKTHKSPHGFFIGGVPRAADPLNVIGRGKPPAAAP